MRNNFWFGAAIAVAFFAVVALVRCGGKTDAQPTPAEPTAKSPTQGTAVSTSLYEHPVTTIAGEKTTLAPHKGKALLIVNTASECGYTEQYKGLQALYEARKDDGLVILGFPCNQFGGQEPGSEPDIVKFVKEKYGVTFPMYAKVAVKGTTKDPLFAELTAGGGEVAWNFAKFLVGRDGKVIARFGSDVAPGDPKLLAAINNALN